MTKLLVLGVVIMLAALALDHLLLWMESRGWIYWRRNRPARGASTFLELTVKDEEDEDDSGDPPAA
jgi:hypothetical protein